MSIEALPEKFINEDGIEHEIIARSKHWSILRQDKGGSIRFVVSPVVEREGREMIVNMEREEIRGYDFPNLDGAVNLFAKLMTHQVIA